MLEGTPRIRENPAGPGTMTVGAPIVLGTPNSVLIDDAGGNLGVSTPLVANRFLFWDGTNFTWTVSGSGNMAIGNPVVGGTTPSVLFIQGGNLAQDPTHFSYNPAILYNLQITDDATYNSQISASQGNVALLENNISNGKSEGLSLDTVRGFNLFGSLGIVSSGINGDSSGTSAIVYHYNGLISATSTYSDTSIATILTNGVGITANNTLDTTQIDLRFINALSQTSYVHGEAGQITIRMDDPSALAQSYSLYLPDSASMRWRLTPPNSQNGIVNIDGGNSMAYMNFSDGIGSTASAIMTPTDATLQWTDSSTKTSSLVLSGTGFDMTASLDNYVSQDYGDNETTYQSFTTPYQIYTDETFTYNPLDILTSSSGGTGTVVSDDGNGIVVLNPHSGNFFSGDQVDDGLGNISNLTADGETYSAFHGVGQNITPTATRYAMFLQNVDPSGVNSRYEIKHPQIVTFNVPSITSSNAQLTLTKNVDSTVNHSFINTSGGTSAALQLFFNNGTTSFMCGVVGSGNTSYGGIYTQNSVRFDNTNGDIAYIVQNSGKKHRFAVGGTATTNVKLDITNTGIDIVKKVDNYNGIATVSNGMPAEYATVDLTGQTAAITATTVYAVPSGGTGMYRISWVATVTTAGSVSSTLGGTNGFQVVYTDGDDAVVKTSPASVTSNANTTGTMISGVEVVYARTGTNIQYQMDYAANAANSMAYNLHIKVEAL